MLVVFLETEDAVGDFGLGSADLTWPSGQRATPDREAADSTSGTVAVPDGFPSWFATG